MKELHGTLLPFLTVALLCAYLLVLIRVFTAGLHRTYRWFTIYAVYETLRLIVVAFIPRNTDQYAYVFFFTQPVTWCLYLLVILELYQLALKNVAGIAAFGRRTLTIAVVVSTLASVATVAFDSQQADFNVLRTYFVIERLILSSLLLLLLVFTAFLAYFPVPVNRNTVTHTRIFACYFLLRTVLLIFRNWFTGDAPHGINIVLSLLATGTLGAWALLLSRAGEEITTATSYRRDPEAEERLITQLDAINSTLLSSAKK